MSDNKDIEIMHANKNIEIIQVLFEDDRVRIERIYSNGWAQPDGENFIADIDEFVTLEKGTAEISLVDGEKVFLKAGDSYLIKRNTSHRVVKTDIDTVWLTVFIKKK